MTLMKNACLNIPRAIDVKIWNPRLWKAYLGRSYKIIYIYYLWTNHNNRNIIISPKGLYIFQSASPFAVSLWHTFQSGWRLWGSRTTRTREAWARLRPPSRISLCKQICAAIFLCSDFGRGKASLSKLPWRTSLGYWLLEMRASISCGNRIHPTQRNSTQTQTQFITHTHSHCNKDTHLTGRLEEIGIAERRTQTEDVVALGMLRYRLHNCTIHDNQVLGRRLHTPALPGIARIEEQRGALQAHPVALPAPLSCQLDLVLLA